MNKIERIFARLFSDGKYFLVEQKAPGELNEACARLLRHPDAISAKSKSRVKFEDDLRFPARFIGWVPEEMPGLFSEDTVTLEIAAAFARQENGTEITAAHLEKTMLWMRNFQVKSLAQKNPLVLSRGERVSLWLLLQLAKKPQYLVLGQVPRSFSAERRKLFFELLNDLSSWDNRSTTIVLGVADALEKQEVLKNTSLIEWKIVKNVNYEIFDF